MTVATRGRPARASADGADGADRRRGSRCGPSGSASASTAPGQGVVRGITYFGHDQLVEVGLEDGHRVRSRMGPVRSFEPGDRVSVAVNGEVIAFPAVDPTGSSVR